MKTYRAIDVAKRFMSLANAEGVAVSHMKLQKLVFFAQLAALKDFNGTPIHSNRTYAWDYGPVVHELYTAIRRFGANPIQMHDESGEDVFASAVDIDDADALAIIDSVWNHFKHWTAFQLSSLTHWKNSPWAVAYSHQRSSEIPLKLIQANGFGEPWPEHSHWW